MEEFRPSSDFVARVMGNVHALEASRVKESRFWDRFVSLRLRCAMSGCGVFWGIFFSAAVCV